MGGPSDLLRLLVLTKHLKLRCWDLVWVQWLIVTCSHVHNYALEMSSGHASDEWSAGGSFGVTPTPGPDRTPSIKVLGLAVGTMVDC